MHALGISTIPRCTQSAMSDARVAEENSYPQHGPVPVHTTTRGRSDSRCILSLILASFHPTQDPTTGNSGGGGTTHHISSSTQYTLDSSAYTQPSCRDNVACHSRPPRIPRNKYTCLVQTAARQDQGRRWETSSRAARCRLS